MANAPFPFLPLAIGAALALAGCQLPVPGLTGPNPGQPPASSGSWTLVESGLTTTLNDVHFVGPGAGFAVGEQGVLLKTIDGLAWQSFKPAALTDKNLLAIDMLDAATGHVVTDKSVLKTTDGGTTWTLLLDVQEQFRDQPLRVRFLDARRAWVVGANALYRTTDGGATWTAQGLDLGKTAAQAGDLRGVGSQAWAWGDGKLRKHFDGIGWGIMLDPASKLETGCHECPAAAAFTSLTDAWFFGGPTRRLYRSQDAGLSWASVPFVDRRGDAVLPGGTLHAGGEVARLAFPNATQGWLLASGTLLSTDDGGKSWAVWQNPPDPSGTGKRPFSPAEVRDFEMQSGSTGWAVGRGGLLARYSRP